jgi:hypothetical protein
MAGTIVCILIVAVVTVYASCIAPRNDATFHGALLNRFRPASFPNLSTLQGEYDLKLYSSAAKDGFISVSTFSDPNCGAVKYTTGVPVNTCYIAQGFAYMFRLVEGSLSLHIDYSLARVMIATISCEQTAVAERSLSISLTRSARIQLAQAPLRLGLCVRARVRSPLRTSAQLVRSRQCLRSP